MKKKLLLLVFALFLVIFSAMAFSACSEVEFKVDFVVDGEVYSTVNTAGKEIIKIPDNPTKEGYTFDGWYWDKDVWQKPFTANSLLDAPLSSDMKVYAKFSLNEPHRENYCSFKTLDEKSGNIVYGKVPNGTAIFSFLNEVETNGTASYGVYLDIICSQEVKSKTVNLVTGDNTFYIWAENTDNGDMLYTVTVRVKPMYEVKFNTLGGTSVEKQIVEEDALAAAPVTTKTGYTLSGWNRSLAEPITENTEFTAVWTANNYTVTLDKTGGTDGANTVTATFGSSMPTATAPSRVGYTFDGYYDASNVKYYDSTMTSVKVWYKTEPTTLYANWIARTDTKYIVNHYQQNADDDGYTFFEKDELYGKSDTSVTPAVKSYAGFTAPTKKTVNINPNGNTVVDYYYTRKSYTINVVGNGGASVQITQKYGSTINTSSVTRSGYELEGLYTDIDLTSKLTTVPLENKTVYAYWKGENRPTDFNYTTSTDGIIITGYKGSSTTVVIPLQIDGKNVITISSYAFQNKSSIISVTIPNSVTSIGNNAFKGCTGLTSISIPNSVKSIGDLAFYNCYKLVEVYNLSSSIIVTKGDSSNGRVGYYALDVYTDANAESKFSNVNGYILYNNGTDRYLIEYTGSDTNLTLPENIGGENYGIHQYAFLGNDKITSVTIPDSVTSIGDRAFYECTGLTSISIPNSVTSIGSWAFSGCTNLIQIENGVSYVDKWVVDCNTSVTYVTLRADIVGISGAAFWDCTGLRSINFNGTIAQWNAIYKTSGWNYNTGNYTIYCTNGNIAKS